MHDCTRVPGKPVIPMISPLLIVLWTSSKFCSASLKGEGRQREREREKEGERLQVTQTHITPTCTCTVYIILYLASAMT